MLSVLTTTVAAAESGEAISPYAVGAIVLAFLMVLLFGVVAFGGGREHS